MQLFTALSSFHFYPRPPRGGRLGIDTFAVDTSNISIHALREEGDVEQFQKDNERFTISIHALREEGDLSCRKKG